MIVMLEKELILVELLCFPLIKILAADLIMTLRLARESQGLASLISSTTTTIAYLISSIAIVIVIVTATLILIHLTLTKRMLCISERFAGLPHLSQVYY